MVEYKYGYFSDDQMDEQMRSLHAALFWLLLYRDPDTAYRYTAVDVDDYIDQLTVRFAALNDLLQEPPVMPALLTKLQEIKKINDSEPFNYRRYRKLVLDAQALVDKLSKGGVANGV